MERRPDKRCFSHMPYDDEVLEKSEYETYENFDFAVTDDWAGSIARFAATEVGRDHRRHLGEDVPTEFMPPLSSGTPAAVMASLPLSNRYAALADEIIGEDVTPDGGITRSVRHLASNNVPSDAFG